MRRQVRRRGERARGGSGGVTEGEKRKGGGKERRGGRENGEGGKENKDFNHK